MQSSFSRIYSAQPHVTGGSIITVEVDIARGLNAFNIVGLPDKAVEEARDRVGSALKNSGYSSPKQENKKTIVSLAPAEVKKEGSFFDLPIALGYLLSSGELDFDPASKLFVGELALNGELQPLRGVLPLVQIAKENNFAEIFVPMQNASEAALVEGITIYPVKKLSDVIQHISPKHPFTIIAQPVTTIQNSDHTFPIDFIDIKGQEHAKRGLEIAASGGHNVGMYGPPGTGKTMLARAFAGILPTLSREEMLEITGIHSIAGTLRDTVITQSPFRSPHHTSSHVAIIGGGTIPKPGEVTLAHRGVLFMDEFPEFDKRVVESLRQPLEDKIVHVARARGSAQFPANFILVAAMNPCPCGYFGSRKKTCTCTPSAIVRYKRKVSGPIMDRIDIWLEVEHIDYEKLSSNEIEKSDRSNTIAGRVNKARQAQHNRQQKKNAELSAKDMMIIIVEDDARTMLNTSAEKLSLSPRSYHRTIKLARTIADLDNAETIQVQHILEALQYRAKET
ncbi:MAG: YifB family Mg chelatase-like AAA ATPase [Candidatus Pacebacteria bacterium]|nr:YifB family Mg chelatase-like AAA ATPase [Candidatus Paceibacterota bacterium]